MNAKPFSTRQNDSNLPLQYSTVLVTTCHLSLAIKIENETKCQCVYETWWPTRCLSPDNGIQKWFTLPLNLFQNVKLSRWQKNRKHKKLEQMRTKRGIRSAREKLGKFSTHWTGEALSKARALKLERHFTLEPHYGGVSSHRRVTHGNRRWMALVSSLQPVFCFDAERSNSSWMNRIFKTIRRVMTITRYFCLNKSYDSGWRLFHCVANDEAMETTICYWNNQSGNRRKERETFSFVMSVSSVDVSDYITRHHHDTYTHRQMFALSTPHTWHCQWQRDA